MTFKLQTIVLMSFCLLGCTGSKPAEDSAATKALLKTQTYLALSAEFDRKSAEADKRQESINSLIQSKYDAMRIGTPEAKEQVTKIEASIEDSKKRQDALLDEIAALRKRMNESAPGTP